MTIAIVAEQTLEELPVAHIRESSTNPRRSFDEVALAELSASIAEIGVQVPLLVRPLCEPGGEVMAYEIVAGARRYRAAVRAGKVTVPCIVREISDDEVREIQIVENLQRAGVDPLEEAEAFDELLKRLGSIPAVAARLGKEQSYVAKLLKLVSLTLPTRDALRARLITIDHALLLARVAETEQNAALKWCLDRNAGVKTAVEKVLEERIARRKQDEDDNKVDGEEGGRPAMWHQWEPQSVVQLKSWMEARSGIVLSRAPWDLTAVDFPIPGVVPCNECPQNTRANSPLFGDLETGEAVCTDGACFQAKTDGFVRIQMRTAEGVAAPVRLSWKISSVKPSITSMPMLSDATRQHETANPAKVLKCGQWIDAKPGTCENVRPGITVDWSDANDRGYMGGTKKLRKPGELVYVCIAVGCKTHPKAWEKAQGRPQQERPDPAAQKRNQEEEKRVEKVETVIRSTLLFTILDKLDAAKAIAIVADNQRDANEWRKRLLNAMPELNGEKLEAFVVLCCEFAGCFVPSGYWLMRDGGVQSERKRIFELAKKAGVDPVKVVAKFFHDQGSIAPASDRLYPKGVPWPKGAQPTATKKSVAKKVASKPSKVVAKGAKSKRLVLSAEGRKRVADAVKKMVAERVVKRSKASKVAAKKGAA